MIKKISYHLNSAREYYLWFKYRNRPYIEFYRAIMRTRTKNNPREATGGGWNETGKMQVERLKRYGMQPHHTIFDLGCGQLRGGRFTIAYLNKGNYTGNDISPDILEEARKILSSENIESKHPNLFLTDNLEFNEVAGKKFDFIHAQSVLSHMPPEDIRILFKNVKKIMHKNSQFLATFFLSRNNKIYPGNNMKNFFFPIEWMISTGNDYGLKVELVETDKKQKLMKITLDSN